MVAGRIQRKYAALLYLVVAGVALGSSGCLVAAATGVAAAGGVGAYFYCTGSVSREYHVPVDQAFAAVQGALADLGITPAGPDHTENGHKLQTRTGDNKKVEVTVTAVPLRVPADGPQTKVSIRVGVFGDQPLSERFLDLVQSRLGGPVPVTALPGPGTAPTSSPETTAPPVATPAPP
jgi:hypothetical protein